MTRALATLAFLAVAALAAAGCGGGEEGYGGEAAATTAPGASSSPEPSGAVVSATVTPKLGRLIVDSNGMTLYDFQKDSGTTSACYGACAKVWPPLLTKGAPQAGEGAAASRLGTTRRKDGALQVTYAGHPLYTYVQDTEPGDTTGNDTSSFGAQWYALLPSGREAGG
jgi:predicted lipoprotein with Yx(FWY)xxD motif